MKSKNVWAIIMMVSFYANADAQDSTNLLSALIRESDSSKIIYTENTFKYTRVVDGQSIINLPAHVLDVRISHRFDPINSGIYNFFGLDAAVMRLGFDYGITNDIMIGAGHSVYQKTYDGFLKIKLLRQSTGALDIPLSVSFVPTIAVNTLRQSDDKTILADRVSYVLQLLLARKFSEKFSLQLMPTFIHADKISFDHFTQNIEAIGIAATHRLSKRVSINGEYYFRLNDYQSSAHNVLSFGMDLGTGGHVFQLHFTNSFGMTEKSFIAETPYRWENRDVLFGFNISRVFQLKKKHH